MALDAEAPEAAVTGGDAATAPEEGRSGAGDAADAGGGGGEERGEDAGDSRATPPTYANGRANADPEGRDDGRESGGAEEDGGAGPGVCPAGRPTAAGGGGEATDLRHSVILLTQVLSITLATGPRRIASRSAGVSCSTIALLPHPREESSSRMASVARYSSRRDSRTGSKALWMDSGPGVAVGVRPADDDRGVRSRGVASPPMRAGESTPFRASQAAEGPTPTERANGRPNGRVELKTAAVEKRGRKGLTKLSTFHGRAQGCWRGRRRRLNFFLAPSHPHCELNKLSLLTPAGTE